MIEVTVNGQKRSIDIDPDMPLAWVLRDEFDLKGTHVCCAIGLCGACTVHVDGEAARSCVLPVSSVEGKSITTIEGLGAAGFHPVQQAWVEENVVQCGYCQSGFVMAAAAFVDSNPAPSDAQISAGLTNICRCGTYARVRSAVHKAAAIKGQAKVPGKLPAKAKGRHKASHGA